MSQKQMVDGTHSADFVINELRSLLKTAWLDFGNSWRKKEKSVAVVHNQLPHVYKATIDVTFWKSSQVYTHDGLILLAC